MFNRLQNYMARSRSIRELHRLDDRQLRDIGISRCEIKSAVYGKLK